MSSVFELAKQVEIYSDDDEMLGLFILPYDLANQEILFETNRLLKETEYSIKPAYFKIQDIYTIKEVSYDTK